MEQKRFYTAPEMEIEEVVVETALLGTSFEDNHGTNIEPIEGEM